MLLSSSCRTCWRLSLAEQGLESPPWRVFLSKPRSESSWTAALTALTLRSLPKRWLHSFPKSKAFKAAFPTANIYPEHPLQSSFLQLAWKTSVSTSNNSDVAALGSGSAPTDLSPVVPALCHHLPVNKGLPGAAEPGGICK